MVETGQGSLSFELTGNGPTGVGVFGDSSVVSGYFAVFGGSRVVLV